ncbi:hypothetical protein [Longimicrobium sp.]|uniref:hypothetical protein n=1 Tax=Longimicrobium sp. TaxID=2029185 RepID=UPI002E3401E2|nr:hypothetical protein [Longimicrobium sp.]HEX6042385.1 hypothetical protein [Longimicrobium sp.]
MTQLPESTQAHKTTPLSKMTRIAIAVVGAVIGFIVITRLLPGGAGPRADAREVLAREWRTEEVLGLTVSSPGRFRAVTIPVPDEMRTAIQKMESYGRNAGQTEMRVSRTEFNAGVPLDLEGSAQGAIDAMRGNPAVTQMRHAHARTEVSGIPAVRTTSTFQVEGRPAHGEILTLLRGRTLWQVQVLGPEKDAPAIARRLMESVRVQQP